MSFAYSVPGPVLQFVVIVTLTVGSPAWLVFGGLVLLGIGDAVAEATSSVAVSEPVASRSGVSVTTSVFKGVSVSVGVKDAVSVGGGSLVTV